MAVVTPAVAGPFDLGTVVVRAALQVDPETAQIRAVSDPIPTILQGIPLDVRSIDLRVDRPGLHPQPDLLRSLRLLGTGAHRLGPKRRSRATLPGRRLCGPRLQAEARPAAQRRHQTSRSPAAHRDPEDATRGRQHRQGLGRPAALGLPRPGQHQDGLHQGPVRRQGLPQRSGLRLRQGTGRRCSTSRSRARSTCAPPTTCCRTWSPT